VLKRLEVGLPDGALDLLKIPLPLTRGEYITLYNAGIGNIDALRSAEQQRLDALIGPKEGGQFVTR
jgi:helicase